MARPRKSVPTYRQHKPSGQARCTINGKDYWLGPWNSPESKREYAKLLDRSASGQLAPALKAGATAAISINELCVKFVAQEFPRYRRADGRESAECKCYQLIIKHLRLLFGETFVSEFGPIRLRRVREATIQAGWSRPFINKQMIRLRHLFRWGVSWEMVPQTVADALKSVEPLRYGDTIAPEPPKRSAVPLEHIQAIKTKLKQKTRDLIDLLLFTGARPTELLSIRTADIDQSGAVWKATVRNHKNLWRGQDRFLYFGPKSQLILRRYLKPFDRESRLFTTVCQTLTESIARGCRHAKVPHFTAYHLRHTAATLLRDEMGIEHAQAVLGHRHIDMTAHYSVKAEAKAVEAVKAFG